MEVLSISKFKLQLRTLIAEVRDLREQEQFTRNELNLSVQKQKQTEAEFSGKFQELHAELASSEELRQKLESQVKYFQNENILLEQKQKELKGTIDSLLQSREIFVNLYEDSTCELKHCIEMRDRKLAVLIEKLHHHMVLFDLIEKEAVMVKKIVDDVQQLVGEKEQVVTGLKGKMESISVFEKEFVEKICFLENQLKNNQAELCKKDAIISEMKEQMEAMKVSSDLHPQLEDLQKTISIKEEVIQNLIAEKQALLLVVQSLEPVLRKIQDTVFYKNMEDQEVPAKINLEEIDRLEDLAEEHRDNTPCTVIGLGATAHTGPDRQ